MNTSDSLEARRRTSRERETLAVAESSELRPGRCPAARTGGGREFHGRLPACGRWLAVGLGVAGSLLPEARSTAQETSELITTQLPFPQYVPIRDDHYGLRIGRVQVRYDISVENVYTDNRNFSNDDRRWDYGLRPTLTIGMFHSFSERQKIQLDVGMGYQWWANVADQSRFYISPRSHVSYVMGIGDVDVSVSNSSSSTSEASSRIEIAGGALANGANDLAFNRINNTTSVGAGWRPGRIGFSGNYSFGMDRSLTDQFTQLDQNRHTFGSSVKFHATAPITLGIAGNYSIYQYLERVQNDGTGYSLSPTLDWRIRDNLTVGAAVGYSQSDFSRSGSIADDDGFAGVTYDISVSHQINKRMNHSAAFSRGADTGLGSNFTDRFVIGYSLSGQLSPVLRPYLNFSYQSASTSGSTGEDADQYRVNVGIGYPFFRRGTLGLSYGAVWRVAESADREYLENRVTLTASYRF